MKDSLTYEMDTALEPVGAAYRSRVSKQPRAGLKWRSMFDKQPTRRWRAFWPGLSGVVQKMEDLVETPEEILNHPVVQEAHRLIGAYKGKKQMTAVMLKQQLGNFIEDYLNGQMPQGTLTNVKVIENGAVSPYARAELDGLSPGNPVTIYSIKAAKKAQKPKRDQEMWAEMRRIISEGGSFYIGGKAEPQYNGLADDENPDWVGISFDDTEEGKAVWDYLNTMVLS